MTTGPPIPPEFSHLTADEMREAGRRLMDAATFAEIIHDDAEAGTVVDVDLSGRVFEALDAFVSRLKAEGKWPPPG